MTLATWLWTPAIFAAAMRARPTVLCRRSLSVLQHTVACTAQKSITERALSGGVFVAPAVTFTYFLTVSE